MKKLRKTDYERKIRALLQYDNPEARRMAIALLNEARLNVNMKFYNRLEKLFG